MVGMAGLHTRRRDVLVAIGAASTVGIAGCSGDGTSDTIEATTQPSTPNQEATEHYDAAIETLVANKETLDTWADSSYEPEQVGTLQERVSSARTELTAA